MREITDPFNTTRKSGTRNIKRQFILFFEGYRTEVQYFTGLKNNKQQSNISSLIDIQVMCRYPTQTGLSDPMQILNLVDDFIALLNDGIYTPTLLANTYLCQQLSDKSILSDITVINDFIDETVQTIDALTDSKGFITNIEKALKICDENYQNIFQNDPGRFESSYPDYNMDRDIICIIIDRDEECRSIGKYHEFISKCKKKGYYPFITNPCFEFWLLLHFDDIKNDIALKSDQIINKKDYIEEKLDKILREYDSEEGYDKDNLNYQRFAHRLNDAIENEKGYCTDIMNMRNKIGSNIGSLILMMRE